MHSEYERMVVENWSNAVRVASHAFDTWEAQVVSALRSESDEIRSAAVATINEADSAKHRRAILELCADSSTLVLGEVLEYLGEFGEIADSPKILHMSELGASAFDVTYALSKLIPDGPGTVDDEDSDERILEMLADWKTEISKHVGGAA